MDAPALKSLNPTQPLFPGLVSVNSNLGSESVPCDRTFTVVEPLKHVDDLRMWEAVSQLRPPSRLTSTDRGRSILIEVNHQLESRMREIRPSGSEGGGTPPNESSLPLSSGVPDGTKSVPD